METIAFVCLAFVSPRSQCNAMRVFCKTYPSKASYDISRHTVVGQAARTAPSRNRGKGYPTKQKKTRNPTEARYGKGTRLPCADHAASLLREPGEDVKRTSKRVCFALPTRSSQYLSIGLLIIASCLVSAIPTSALRRGNMFEIPWPDPVLQLKSDPRQNTVCRQSPLRHGCFGPQTKIDLHPISILHANAIADSSKATRLPVRLTVG